MLYGFELVALGDVPLDPVLPGELTLASAHSVGIDGYVYEYIRAVQEAEDLVNKRDARKDGALRSFS